MQFICLLIGKNDQITVLHEMRYGDFYFYFFSMNLSIMLDTFSSTGNMNTE